MFHTYAILLLIDLIVNTWTLLTQSGFIGPRLIQDKTLKMMGQELEKLLALDAAGLLSEPALAVLTAAGMSRFCWATEALLGGVLHRRRIVGLARVNAAFWVATSASSPVQLRA